MEHQFDTRIVWTGNVGQGTRTYRGYERTWEVAVAGRAPILCSNDPRLGGDPKKMNPEDMLLSALSACHMLWYLHLASDAGIIVESYEDSPVGHAESDPSGAGRFTSAVLRPQIGVAPNTDLARADAIHHKIGKVCFIARSVAFPIDHQATYKVVPQSGGETA